MRPARAAGSGERPASRPSGRCPSGRCPSGRRIIHELGEEPGERSPLTVPELAERLAVPGTAVSDAVAALLCRRLVARVGGRVATNPAGGRYQLSLWALVEG